MDHPANYDPEEEDVVGKLGITVPVVLTTGIIIDMHEFAATTFEIALFWTVVTALTSRTQICDGYFTLSSMTTFADGHVMNSWVMALAFF